MSRNEFVFRYRNTLAALPIAAALVEADRTQPPHWGVWSTAVLLTVLGVLTRTWANRHCNYNTRAKNILARTGPYALVRNPLYVGNTLIVVGAITASQVLWLLPAALTWVGLIYNLAVRREEQRMLARYGDEYAQWFARVPRWIPRPSSVFPSREHLRVALRDCAGLVVLAPFVAKELNLFGLWS